ncbi:MAG: ACP S-malonyltransferase [Bowdeniella nasicola]|nr:ACP S-malonyltransferase [Bowdeniella nasicola]
MEDETVANVLAVLCPGQGSQQPGMLHAWMKVADNLDLDGGGLIDTWSAAADLDLTDLGTYADADTIRKTEYAQPLIVATSLLSWHCYQAATGARPGLVAGHSIGEVAALAVAGIISDTDAVKLAAIRGGAMARAVHQAPGSAMAAVVGGQIEPVASELRARGLTPANINAPGQVVAAGTSDAIAALRADPPRGTRVLPLEVAGAFHTDMMASATQAVAATVDTIRLGHPRCPVVSNADGAPLRDAREALARIPTQITNSVRWDLCQTTIAALATHAVELAPARVLSGLAKRAMKTLTVRALKPAQLEKEIS